MKKPKATAGERIASQYVLTPIKENHLARRIDAAIRRAVKEAYWHGRHDGWDDDGGSPTSKGRGRVAIELQYKVRL